MIFEMRYVFSLFVLVIMSGLYSCTNKKASLPCGELEFHSLIQPAPLSAKFINDSMYIWGGSLIKSATDNKYHLFYSRWPRKLGMNGWVSHSEVVHAVSDSPCGPFVYKSVALPVRGEKYWDGMMTHNPTIHYFNGKYYLYYTGNTGDGKSIINDLNWTHRNNQRIGVAVADDPDGSWERLDYPVIDVSADSTAYDALMTSNPSITQMPDGHFLLIYKAVARHRPLPFGGPVVHLAAIGSSPTGPFVKQAQPVFTAEGSDFPAEDPYIWYDKDCYYAIVKDINGFFTDAGKSLVLFYSHNGLDWKLADEPLVTIRELIWEDGTVQKLERLERPQLYFEKGKPVVLLCAARETLDHSFNVQIPLKH